MGKRRPGEHEIDRGKSHVEVMIKCRKGGIKSTADLLALQGTRGGIDGNLSDGLANVERPLWLLERRRVLNKIFDLFGDKFDVGSKRFGGKAKFDELTDQLMNNYKGHCAYLLLFHQFGVGTVVHHMAAKNRRRQRRVHFLGANVSKLAVQDKVVSLCTQVNSGLLAEENESENIAILPEEQMISGDVLLYGLLISNTPLRGNRKRTCTDPSHN